MDAASLVPVPLLVGVFAAAIVLGGSHWLPRLAIDLVAIAAALISLVACLLLVAAAREHAIVYWAGGWQPRDGIAIGIAFYVDATGAMVASLACALITGALVYSARYFEAFEGRYHATMLVFLVGLVGFSLTLDLFSLLVWFELIGVTAYALTGYHRADASAVQGGINFAVTNSVGSFVTLLGLALIYGHTGALNLAQIGAAVARPGGDALEAVAAVFVCTGLLVKAAIVPFHFWLADAHAVAPTAVSIVFSGVMAEIGLYAVARVYWSAFASANLGPALSSVLLGVAVVTVIVGALMCFAQQHLKRLLAFSTISHMGLVLAGIALLEPRALAGALVYMTAYGLATAALFACVGILLHRFASVNEARLHASAGTLLGVFVVFVLAVLALAGAPPFGTFHGRDLIATSLHEAGLSWIDHVLSFGTIVSAGAVLRAGLRIFLGWGRAPRLREPGQRADVVGTETLPPHGRIPAVLWGPAAAFVIGAAAVGGAMQLWQPEAVEQAAAFAQPARYAHDVLGTAADVPLAAAPALPSGTSATWLVDLCGAIAVALLAIFAPVRIPAVGRVLRAIHAGDISHYMTWLFVGVAAMTALVVALVT